MREATNDDEGLIVFLQQCSGYVLTGDIREHRRRTGTRLSLPCWAAPAWYAPPAMFWLSIALGVLGFAAIMFAIASDDVQLLGEFPELDPRYRGWTDAKR
jgi:hypothetical protein